MTQTADPFATARDFGTADDRVPMADRTFGQVYNGRYHMPVMSGEKSTKDGEKCGRPWVSRGMMRATNLASAFSDSEALNVWEQEQIMIGLAMDPSLFEEVCLVVHEALRAGVNFQRLDLYPEVRRALTGSWRERDASISGRAKQTAGANRARQAGINRHRAWEHKAATGEAIGTPAMQEQIAALDALLAANHLIRLPGLSERVVRNTEVNCAGRFDDILLDVMTGRMIMADLKNKARKFWSWMEVDIQLAIYARSALMLDGERYVDGPASHVDQSVGCVLVMPSDGRPPYLRKADLVRGWANALRAREIVDERAYGKSVEREHMGAWAS